MLMLDEEIRERTSGWYWKWVLNDTVGTLPSAPFPTSLMAMAMAQTPELFWGGEARMEKGLS